MSGGRFLVSLTEVVNSERILLLRSIIREDINFWNEDIFENSPETTDAWYNFKVEISNYATEIQESILSKDSLEVLTTIAGYIVKKINKKLQCNDCKKKLIASSGEKINDEYLALLSRGGLTFPQKWFADYCASIFCALSISESIIQRHSSIVPRHAARYIITEYVDGSMQSCNEHNVNVEKHTINCCINIFYNNKQKQDGDRPRKDGIKMFKKRQRCNEK